MKKLLFSCLLIFGFSSPSNAIPLTVNMDDWTPFTFDLNNWDQTFDFTLTEQAELRITDAFEPGDEFNILNFGTSIGLTSTVSGVGINILDDYDEAFAGADWSSGLFILDPGIYQITADIADASPVVSAGGVGQGGIRVDTVTSSIPEPASIWLSLMGLSSLLFLRRKSVQQR